MNYLTCSRLLAPTHNFSFAKCRVPARGGQNTVMQLTKWGLRGTAASALLISQRPARAVASLCTLQRLFKRIQGKPEFVFSNPCTLSSHSLDKQFGETQENKPTSCSNHTTWGAARVLARMPSPSSTAPVGHRHLARRQRPVCSTRGSATVSRPTNRISAPTPAAL